MALIQRARDSGTCPPALLSDNRVINGDGFEGAVTKILDFQGLSLALDRDVATLASDFESVMKMTELGNSGVTKEVLEFRRCIVIAIVGSTPVESISVRAVLEGGYLSHVKTWYDQILQGKVGGVDLLLHLLSNIKDLPVTKGIVKQSGLGKAIGAIEKHSICAGTPNETAILDRVNEIKSSWNASVKAQKDKELKPDKPIPKRQIQLPGVSSPSPAKKPRIEEKKPASKAFASLLKKVAGATPEKKGISSTGTPIKSPGASTSDTNDTPRSKKSNKRVKWADHFGGNLTASRLLDSLDVQASAIEVVKGDDGTVSWTDRKKRDRLKEKELLAKAKKAKLMDDDDDVEPVSRMKPTREWRPPSPLPDNPEVTKPQLSSREIPIQIDRMTKVQRVRYVSDEDVPDSPAPLSDVEQALDMTSVASAVVATIPFFVPQASAPAPVIAPAPTPTYVAPIPLMPSAPPIAAYVPPPQSAHEAATLQTVQALGLPMFLVGQNVQALQTLASSPSLLSTLVEPNGMYDQPRLMSLVQTLSQNVAPPQPPPGVQIGGLPGYQPPAPAPSPYGGHAFPPAGGGGIYGPASAPAPGSSFGQHSASSFGGSFPGGGRGDRFRGDSNSDGNLHISGYGPTTSQSDVIALFAPYVKVDEVVLKGTFAFVNTNDPLGAKQAKEALNGALLGGMPVRINMAQRRSRDPNFAPSFAGAGPGAGGGPPSHVPIPDIPKAMSAPVMGHRNEMPPFHHKPPAFGQLNVDDVRDDRGNPATKNLFVAGYGPSTSEPQLREVFAQYATIVGVVTKGTFSFVNTSEKIGAIRAREGLMNTVLNGGVLRINFAKETGRLGTSFDLTYGPSTGGPSHYGRGGY